MALSFAARRLVARFRQQEEHGKHCGTSRCAANPVMDRRLFLVTASAFCIVTLHTPEAQQAGRIYRIGVLANLNVTTATSWRALLDGLKALGWIEGQNFMLEQRFAEVRSERLPSRVSQS